MNNKEYHKEYRLKNKDKIYSKQKEWRIKNRQRLNQINTESRNKNILRNRAYAKLRHFKEKDVVIKSYSKTNPPSCECCGESHWEFLTIDHIYGNGSKHKREIKRRNIYPWLIKNNFPEGFRVLCFNCNCSLGFYGKCPHNPNLKTEKDPILKNEEKLSMFDFMK